MCVLSFIQGRADYVAQGSNQARDKAKQPLFSYVNEDKLKHLETYARESLLQLHTHPYHSFVFYWLLFVSCADFINLLDNYEVSTGVSETVTSEELQENRLFIDAIVKTNIMKV